MLRALPANCVSAAAPGGDAVGHQVLQEVLLQRPWKLANIGKAVNTASITVNSGTSAISVVKVRLPAVRPRRSSRKRWRSVRRVSNQGQRAASAAGSCSRARPQRGHGPGVMTCWL
jgi:hypothetical protein